jgi:hypothetical protein
VLALPKIGPVLRARNSLTGQWVLANRPGAEIAACRDPGKHAFSPDDGRRNWQFRTPLFGIICLDNSPDSLFTCHQGALVPPEKLLVLTSGGGRR